MRCCGQRTQEAQTVLKRPFVPPLSGVPEVTQRAGGVSVLTSALQCAADTEVVMHALAIISIMVTSDAGVHRFAASWYPDLQASRNAGACAVVLSISSCTCTRAGNDDCAHGLIADINLMG